MKETSFTDGFAGGRTSPAPAGIYGDDMPRTALIIDDSRTALASLSRLLKERGADVDTAESGPEALDYLRSNTPGVIFLDHMMPGMDGFETLAALKANARTAFIPVVMYTSREGDAYMGRALVLGAYGVLQKPVDSMELEKMLQRVDRLRKPAHSAPPALDPARHAAANPPGAMPPRPSAAVTGVIRVPPEFRTQAMPVSHANTRPADGLRATTSARKSLYTPWLERFPVWRVLLAIVLLLPGAWYFERYQQAEKMRAQMQVENEALRAEQRSARENAEAAETGQPAELDTSPLRNQLETRGLLDTLTWALNQNGQYGFGDEALSDARLAQVRELIARLGATGFQGTVRLETHTGEFCLVRDEQGSLRLPGDNLVFNRCEVVTYPPATAVQNGLRQSPAFTRYLAERRGRNPVAVAVVSHGTNRPLVGYPDLASVQTAGDWNQIARLNQRVEVVLVPTP
jgi:CheY-like chemotaxis protein